MFRMRIGKTEKCIVLAIILIILFIFQINIPEKTKKSSYNKKESIMVDYLWFQFQDTTYGLTHLPQNTHLFIETTLYLYYVSADDNTQLWKYTKSTGSDALVETRDHIIQDLWYDRANGKIYGLDCDNDGTADDFDVWYIEISDDSVTDVGTSAGADANTVYAYWLVIYNNNIYVHDEETIGGQTKLIWWLCTGAPFSIETSSNIVGHIDADVTFATLIGDGAWFLADDHPSQTMALLRYDIGDKSYASKEEWALSRLVSTNRNLHAISYDGSDLLYFALTNLAGDTVYIESYSIGTDTTTEIGVYNVSLMLDRNCIGTANSPLELEKGFHITNSYIYQIHRTYAHLIKIQDLGLTGGATIKAISDTFLIDSNKNVYEFTDNLTAVVKCTRRSAINSISEAYLTYDEKLSQNQVVELYQLVGSTYTLLFRGFAGVPIYDTKTNLYTFSMVNWGGDDFVKPISYTASVKTIPTCAKLMLSDSTVEYIHTSLSYLKTTATTVSYTFDGQQLQDNLYTLRVRGNAFWAMEPKGLLHMRSYTSMVSSSLEFSASNCLLLGYNVGQAVYNTWDINGGWDNTANAPYNTKYVDSAHKQQYGELLWKGRVHFPEARTQAATSATAVAFKSWQGMQDNPYNIKIVRVNTSAVQVGQKANFQFSYLNTEFGTASSYCIVQVDLNLKYKDQTIYLSNNVVRE